MKVDDRPPKFPWASAHAFVDLTLWIGLRGSTIHTYDVEVYEGYIKARPVERPCTWEELERQAHMSIERWSASSQASFVRHVLARLAVVDGCLMKARRRLDRNKQPFHDARAADALIEVWRELNRRLQRSDPPVVLEQHMLESAYDKLPHAGTYVPLAYPFAMSTRLPAMDTCILSECNRELADEWRKHSASPDGRLTDQVPAVVLEPCGTPCSSLLDSSSAVWPDHVCPTTYLASVQRLVEGDPGWGIRVTQWPQPLGPRAEETLKSLAAEVEDSLAAIRLRLQFLLSDVNPTDDPQTFRLSLVNHASHTVPKRVNLRADTGFDKDEWLILTVEKRVECGMVRLFGLVNSEWEFLPPRFEVHETDQSAPSRRLLQKLESDMARWYRRIVMGASPRSAGRKLGPSMPLDELTQAYGKALSEAKSKQLSPSISTVARLMGMPRSTLQGYIDQGILSRPD